MPEILNTGYIIYYILYKYIVKIRKLYQMLCQALQEADRFRVLAQRRREAVTKTEEEERGKASWPLCVQSDWRTLIPGFV